MYNEHYKRYMVSHLTLWYLFTNAAKQRCNVFYYSMTGENKVGLTESIDKQLQFIFDLVREQSSAKYCVLARDKDLKQISDGISVVRFLETPWNSKENHSIFRIYLNDIYLYFRNQCLRNSISSNLKILFNEWCLVEFSLV